MNHKKWNAIVSTIYIMLVLAVIVLIITKFTMHLVEISHENVKYYKAYYMANAWVELELLKLKHRGIGFSDTVKKDSDTVEQNFDADEQTFSAELRARWNYINANPYSLLDQSDCSHISDFIHLKPWESILLWAFYDQWDDEEEWEESVYSGDNYALVENWADISLYGEWETFVWVQTKDNVGLYSHTYNLTENDAIHGKDLSADINMSLTAADRPFVIIANLDTEERDYCVKNLSAKPVSNYSFILSKGRFQDRHVQIRVVKYHKWAKFVIYNVCLIDPAACAQ